VSSLASFLFIVLLVGYWAWPFVDQRTLAGALQVRNAAALSEQVDFEYLRRNLTAQIIATYPRITGRESRLGPLRALARASERDAIHLARPCAQALAIWKDGYNTSLLNSALLPRNGTGPWAISRAPRPVPLHNRTNKAQMTQGICLVAG
jgi:hypothetical protein